MRILNRWCASALTCMMWAMPQAQAQSEVTVERGYVLLDEFFAGLNTLQSNFEQTVQDSRNTVIESSAGTLVLKKPGKFRWDYVKPNAQTIVSDGKRIWLYDPELEQVTIRRADLSLNGTPAMLLSGEGKLRDSFEIENVQQQDGITIINLVPKRADTDFKRVQIGLRKDVLVAMALTDKLGQSTLLQFKQFKRNASVSDAQFNFTPPRGVDVVDNTGPGPKAK